MANGKPDLSGLWTANQSCPTPGRECGRSGPGPFASRELNDIGVSLPGGLPYQPWLAALVKERTANHAKDDPHVRCFPDFFLRAVTLREQFGADAELIDEICLENEKDAQHLK
jgi:hypothetical protein